MLRVVLDRQKTWKGCGWVDGHGVGVFFLCVWMNVLGCGGKWASRKEAKWKGEKREKEKEEEEKKKKKKREEKSEKLTEGEVFIPWG